MGEAARMKAVQSNNPLDEVARVAPRAVFTWQIPKPLCDEVPNEDAEPVKSFSLQQLTAREELAAMKRCQTEPMKAVHEMILQCLVKVNGQKVSLADGSVDKMFNSMVPAVRSLVTQAYNEIHNPSEDVKENFHKSRSVEVI